MEGFILFVHRSHKIHVLYSFHFYITQCMKRVALQVQGHRLSKNEE